MRPSIQFKATFLTLVFLLNTIVSFACTLGVDMGYNRTHHQDQNIIHSDEHIHGEKKSHDHDKSKHHESSADHHASKNSKDDCCKDELAKLTKADKLNQRGFDYSLLSISVFTLPSTFNLAGHSTVFAANTPKSYFIRHYRLLIPDVRIAIQSFQI
ncbi:MAG: hypothetical protein ABI390_05575 [Daejeonella sp.]